MLLTEIPLGKAATLRGAEEELCGIGQIQTSFAFLFISFWTEFFTKILYYFYFLIMEYVMIIT